MKCLWIYFLPLLYLPNFGIETETAFGTLTVADYLIVPYLFLVFHAIHGSKKRANEKRYLHFLIPTLLVFLWWASISSLTIAFRYEYRDMNLVVFSLLKLGKLSLYGVAALLTIRALAESAQPGYSRLLWSILCSGLLVGGLLLVSGNSFGNILPGLGESRQVFLDNPTSVLMSILIAFLVGMILEVHGSRSWRYCTTAGLLLMISGLIFAEGRGGWIAVLVAMLYIGFRINLKQTLRLTMLSILLFVLIYNQNPNFQKEVHRTLDPDPIYLEQYNIGVVGFDDGGRVSILQSEIPKILQAPILGRGFFHRGGLSGLFSTGSHNFFIQMFLETGIIGGILICALFRQMWRHASSSFAMAKRLTLPVKASLVAAIVSGLSGEYFYGGMVLFTLLLTYAPVGALSVAATEISPSTSRATSMVISS